MGHSDARGDALRLIAWGADDLPLLRRLMGDPALMTHLGGPEDAEQIAVRQGRYEVLAARGEGRMFKVVLAATGAAVGSVGYWGREWRGEPIGEIGWMILPDYQGRGIAGRAAALALDRARADGRYRAIHAFPATDNPPSNAICRTLGFALVEECDFEYPAGHIMRCNSWRLDLATA